MKHLIVVSALLSSACSSITFDGGQFDRYITLTETSRSSISQCGTPEISKKIVVLKQQIAHINLYASYRKASPEVAVASQKLQNIISELSEKYETVEPSKTYCEEKLKNIVDSANTISATLGAQ